MKKLLFTLLVVVVSVNLYAQKTFKAGWNTYNVGMTIYEFTYQLNYADSPKLFMVDSAMVVVSPDSLVTVTYNVPRNYKSFYKTVHFLNPKKQIVKKEDYSGDNLTESNEWKYDEKNRKLW